jgi:lipopolysaccharide transport system permease protein
LRSTTDTSSRTSQHSASPLALVASGWRNRQLIAQLARRDILGRYRGSALGVLWSLINPMLMLAVYTFVFSVVFRTRWPDAPVEGRTFFAVVLFAGMIVFGIFSECVQRAPNAIVSQPNFVKKVVFPLEILPWVMLLTALFHAGISLVVLIGLMLLTLGSIPWTIALLPVVLLPLVAMCLGLGWFLASLGVYVRDVGQVVGVTVTALMFLSPMFYPSSALPGHLRFIATINPVAFPIEATRGVVVFGHLPAVGPLILSFAIGAALLLAGFAWFQKTRRGFADVI